MGVIDSKRGQPDPNDCCRSGWCRTGNSSRNDVVAASNCASQANHPHTVSIDFFTVPTITLKVLFVFIVLEHRRREVLHFGVTEHPSAAWTSQQIVEAFADRNVPQYLIRDRDSIYGNDVRLRIASLGTKEVLTAPRSP